MFIKSQCPCLLLLSSSTSGTCCSDSCWLRQLSFNWGGGTSLSGLPYMVSLPSQALSASGGRKCLLTLSEACQTPIALPREQLSSVSASAGWGRVRPLLSAELNFSPWVLSSRSFHDWWLIEGYLAKVHLDLTQINLLLAVTFMTMLLGMPMPLHAFLVMPMVVVVVVVTVPMMTMMVTVGLFIVTFFLRWCMSLLLRLHVCCIFALVEFQWSL